jgi:hypothetical protein
LVVGERFLHEAQDRLHVLRPGFANNQRQRATLLEPIATKARTQGGTGAMADSRPQAARAELLAAGWGGAWGASLPLALEPLVSIGAWRSAPAALVAR